MITQADFESLLSLFAYDSGCVDIGIHDELLCGKLRVNLAKWAVVGRKEYEFIGKALSIPLTRMIRDEFISDAQLAQGYTFEDMFRFIDWLASEMDFEIAPR